MKKLAVSGLLNGAAHIRSTCSLTGKCFDIGHKSIPPSAKTLWKYGRKYPGRGCGGSCRTTADVTPHHPEGIRGIFNQKEMD